MRIQHFDIRSELVLEDALSPILVATWVGTATVGLVAHFRQWADEQVALALTNRVPLVLISDATSADRPPAEVRRALAHIVLDPQVPVRSYVVVTSPLVRGAMTAIGWMAGNTHSNIACQTVGEALDLAAEYVRSLGLYPPSDPEFVRYWARTPIRETSAVRAIG